jgi:hypothetical protein
LNYNTQPLAVSVVNWGSFINTCKAHFGESPTRCLDKAHISIDKLHAFLATLGFNNDPYGTLRKGRYLGNVFNHVFFSTISEQIPDDVVGCLAKNASLSILHHKAIVITSGVLTQWYDSLITCSRIEQLRPLVFEYLFVLDSNGFRDLFHEYNRVKKTNGVELVRR